ncbi:MAG TPA: FAD/NAD(P)-binding oxidoreductase [Methylophilaceae bacterium]|nr:FAD/NAD(P)-binding oxidoreductase [Methylophilaceae bacterium]
MGQTKANHQFASSKQKISVYDIVIIGGGTAGISVAASILKRRPDLSVAIIEPNGKHFYQPAWTLVGRGVFDVNKTCRPMESVIPPGATWIQSTADFLNPDMNQVIISGGRVIQYDQLIVCPGLRLAWEKIEGLSEALGKNGVTSNYRFDLAPYTWTLVSQLKNGNAIYSQPPMPIKCAGAPQKAMYLSCDHWLKKDVLKNINVEFHNAGGVLFGVAAFVPPLMKYVEKYNAKLVFNSNLVKVDGNKKLAWFDYKDFAGNIIRKEKSFDLLHVVPPQVPPDLVKNSPLADAAGWCEVDHATLRHPRYHNVFSLGDVCSAPNAKTAAAARKQVVIVAENLIAARQGRPLTHAYDGYGSCPLTVETGKIILAEFGYGGKLLPTFPLNPIIPRYTAWFLKATLLPWFYWNCMLKGHEWLTKCTGSSPSKQN